MGSPKQLLPFAGGSLLGHATRTAVNSRCGSILAVLGANAETIQQDLEATSVQIVANPNWREGMSSSIRAGLKALVASVQDVQAVIFMLCDQPLVTAEHIDSLIDLFEETETPLVVSGYEGRKGSPALFARSLFPQLLALQGPEGAKPVIEANRHLARTVPFPEGSLDIDTPEDYRRIMAILGR